MWSIPTRKAPKQISGFTLIEVMLVVLLIGVLSAIAYPQYANYRERINQAHAITDIRVLQTLIKAYAIDAGGYPETLGDVANANRLDPWGRPYFYLDLTSVKGKGKARKDRKFNPLNSDFDLYSLGKDGVSKTQLTNKESLDDIVRAADGAYIGLAADYSP